MEKRWMTWLFKGARRKKDYIMELRPLMKKIIKIEVFKIRCKNGALDHSIHQLLRCGWNVCKKRLIIWWIIFDGRVVRRNGHKLSPGIIYAVNRIFFFIQQYVYFLCCHCSMITPVTAQTMFSRHDRFWVVADRVILAADYANRHNYPLQRA